VTYCIKTTEVEYNLDSLKHSYIIGEKGRNYGN
jgi:hypothetical protein